MENTKVYCILCGAENKSADKFCHSCGQSLHQQETELQDYLKEKVKDKVKDEVKSKAENAFLALLKKLLSGKAYGFLMSLSFVAATATAVAGGTGTDATEFSAPIPGQFINGRVYAREVESGTSLYSGYYTIYADTSSSNTTYYVKCSYNSVGMQLEAKDSTGTLLTISGSAMDIDDGDVYAFTATDPVFYISGRDTDSSLTERFMETTIEFDSSYGISRREDKVDGQTSLLEEYISPGVLIHSIYTDRMDSERFAVRENTYDEQGRPLVYRYINTDGAETSRSEYEYFEDGSYTTTDYELGLISKHYKYDAQAHIVEDTLYVDGEFFSKDEYEYYPSGAQSAHTMYNGSYVGALRYEYYEDGTIKAYITLDTAGNVETRQYYDTEGNLIS